jgi:uncharacterized protein with HEPN domain
MSKDTRVYIKHILESITYIEQYTSGITRETFFDSPQLQDAVIRRLEIIGEPLKISQKVFETKNQMCLGVR